MPSQSRECQMLAVAQALQQGDRYVLAGHVDPDPDCVGSILALDWALRSLEKTSIPVIPEPILPSWHFFPYRERLRSPEQVNRDEWDNLVVVDCEVERTGAVAEWAKSAHMVINIDHHVTNAGTVAIRLLDTTAAASGELIYDLIATLGLSLNPEVATLLFAAIVSDTGSFRFSNTDERILHTAADLVHHGARPDYIARELYENHTWGFAKLLQRVLATMERSEDGQVAWITVTNDMLSQTDARKDEAEGLIKYPRMIDGVEVAMAFREIGPEETRVGFRSKERVDVSAVAAEFGGGGHARASGCTLSLPVAQARTLVISRVLEYLRTR